MGRPTTRSYADSTTCGDLEDSVKTTVDHIDNETRDCKLQNNRDKVPFSLTTAEKIESVRFHVGTVIWSRMREINWKRDLKWNKNTGKLTIPCSLPIQLE